MMHETRTLRVMAVHGVGRHYDDLEWITAWRAALSQGIRRWNPELAIEFDFVTYNDLFERRCASEESLAARLWTILGPDCGKWIRRQRKLGKPLERASEELQAAAGMVVEWMTSNTLRRAARRRIAEHLESFQPDVLCAHSLGSLIAYDALAREDLSAQEALTFVSFGSQIGNRCVQQHFPQRRLSPLAVRRWYHLYNRHDDIFTAPIQLDCNRFTQIDIPFNLPGPGDHAALAYLERAEMSEHVWRPLLEPQRLSESMANFQRTSV